MSNDTKFFLQEILAILSTLDISSEQKQAINDLWYQLREVKK